ncbi:hypothetical protein H0H87_004271 [Tephrocybe sp. NHM501043]|nr:hypothetical protein H0H87_004271 [Tephrocybe sp. NHM501043]
MQQPTLSGVRIRSSNDVHRIFYAVRLGLLKMLERRLDNEERDALGSGCVYVWEVRGSRQSNDVTGEGMDRFTEGKQWGPSRVRDDFLFYTQKHASAHTHPWDHLVKQTYSAWVDTSAGKRKWQLTAYFTDNTVDTLRTIDDFPTLRDVHAPPGMFQSAKTRTSKSKRRVSNEQLGPQRLTPAALHSDAPSSSSFSSEPVAMVQPYTNRIPQPPAHRPIPLLPRPPMNGRAATSVPIGGIGSNSSTPWRSTPLPGGGPTLFPDPLQHGHTPFSLPPVDTFGEHHLGYADRTPSPAGSAAHSLMWDSSYELTSRAGSAEDGNRESRLALAPIHGLNRRVYIRDPLDDKALRSLPS